MDSLTVTLHSDEEPDVSFTCDAIRIEGTVCMGHTPLDEAKVHSDFAQGAVLVIVLVAVSAEIKLVIGRLRAIRGRFETCATYYQYESWCLPELLSGVTRSATLARQPEVSVGEPPRDSRYALRR